MKYIKYTIGSLLVAFALQVQGASLTVTLGANSWTGVLTNYTASGQAIITGGDALSASLAATLSFIDSPDGTRTYTNAPYYTVSQVSSNYVTSYTNFFGTVNSFTNIALVNATNTVVGSTNTWPTRFTVFVPTNQPVAFVGTSYHIQNGLWVTNTSASAVTLVLNYQE